MWEANAKVVEEVYDGYVSWRGRVYLCPKCGESIYECDWSVTELTDAICPVCGFDDKRRNKYEPAERNSL